MKSRTAVKKTNRKQTRVKGNEDRWVGEFFIKRTILLPMIVLIEQSSAAIDEMIDVVGRGAVEAVLQLSACSSWFYRAPQKTHLYLVWF
jgi:hypothetical protein